ncbi:MAG: NlpC/P60 family protein [Roseburia sp.]|nr:NlpC/P60 family protein [Ruminococcus sp.]MCM1155557.1 NlpC/P60 family protein [Roseburia sp.]MCM1243018.1 NlpC/P60 family protein [Roseburia sp.]
MKRKELCYLFIGIMLCRPIFAFAAGDQTPIALQQETQAGELNKSTLKEEYNAADSPLGSLTAGAELVGSGMDMSGTGMTQNASGSSQAESSGNDSTGADTSVSSNGAVDQESISGTSVDKTDDTAGKENSNNIEDTAGDKIEDNEAETEDDSSIRDILGEPVGASAIVEARKTLEEYAQAYEDAKNANWGYTNLGIANVDNNLNIRAIPAEDGKLVGKLPKNAACEVIESDGMWAHIKSGKVEGYVSCDYLLTGLEAKRKAEELVSAIATVTTDALKVRAEANTDSEVITMVPNGEKLEVAAAEGDWIRVYLDDEEVFVSADYVRVDAQLETAITMTELLYGQGVSDVRVDLCQYAKEYLGNPYVWGGTSLTNGADCSGYVLSVFKKYNVSLPHSSRAQANCGTTIKLSEAKPGDLVFYGNGQTINHVAIYIGGGQVIHASNPRTGIRISNVSYRTPIKVVRILQD